MVVRRDDASDFLAHSSIALLLLSNSKVMFQTIAFSSVIGSFKALVTCPRSGKYMLSRGRTPSTSGHAFFYGNSGFRYRSSSHVFRHRRRWCCAQHRLPEIHRDESVAAGREDGLPARRNVGPR